MIDDVQHQRDRFVERFRDWRATTARPHSASPTRCVSPASSRRVSSTTLRTIGSASMAAACRDQRQRVHTLALRQQRVRPQMPACSGHAPERLFAAPQILGRVLEVREAVGLRDQQLERRAVVSCRAHCSAIWLASRVRGQRVVLAVQDGEDLAARPPAADDVVDGRVGQRCILRQMLVEQSRDAPSWSRIRAGCPPAARQRATGSARSPTRASQLASAWRNTGTALTGSFEREKTGADHRLQLALVAPVVAELAARRACSPP